MCIFCAFRCFYFIFIKTEWFYTIFVSPLMEFQGMFVNLIKKNSFSLFKKIMSYIAPDILELRKGELTSLLQVKLENGKLILDASHVNYSFGGLHLLFERVFRRLDFQNYKPEKILILGYGVGSIGQILRNEYGLKSHITAVELDAIVIELGGRYFKTTEMENFRMYNMDASDYVKSSRETFDLIFVDVFIESFVPESVRTQEFLNGLQTIMNPGATLIFNYMVYDKKSGENFKSLENKLKGIFDDFKTLYINDPGNDNHVLIARKKTFAKE